MTLEKLNAYILSLYYKETDPHTREVIDKIWRAIPSTGDLNEVPCYVGKRDGYKWLCWARDDIIPKGEYPWDYKGKFAERTYAIVKDNHGNVMRVKPEKIKFDNREAERWEDLHG